MAAFISGATRGIGLALVKKLLAAPTGSVIAAGRSVADSAALRELREQYSPERLVLVPMDVAEESSITSAVAGLDPSLQIETLVHCAAMMHPSGKGETSIAKVDAESMSTVLATNVIGPATLTAALWPRLRRKKAELEEFGPSKIIAVGAGVGSIGTNAAGGWYSYRVSKTALQALMMNLAIEGKRSGVHAFSLYPEMVETEFSAPYQRNNPYDTLRTPEETAERMLELVSGYTAADSGRFVNIWSEEDIPW